MDTSKAAAQIQKLLQQQQSQQQNPIDESKLVDGALETDAVDFQKLLKEAQNQKIDMDFLNKLAQQGKIDASLLNQLNPDVIAGLLDDLHTNKKEASADDIAAMAALAAAIGAQAQNIKVDSLQAPKEQAPLAKTIDAVASQILVSHPDLNAGKSEVLIAIRQDVLDGAQVRVSRQEGQLQVVFESNVKDTANFLAQNQNVLATTLSERLNEPVNLKVNEVFTTVHQASPEQNEGRSRNQRSVLDEYNPDSEA